MDVVGRLRASLEDFELLLRNDCRRQKSQHSQDKNLTNISQKKLAGIQYHFHDVAKYEKISPKESVDIKEFRPKRGIYLPVIR